MHIPFNRPYFAGTELDYISKAIHNGKTSGDGEFTKLSQKWITSTLGCHSSLLTTSCTDALELSGLLIELQEGDEVIVPSYTFVSTVNAFVLRGAKPIFVDITPDTLNINPDLIEAKITPKTKAIIPVHYAGVSCDMDKIMSISQKYNLCVIEDNAHGFLGKYKNKYLGTIGHMATQSFHETKNISCGEGGALIINQDKFFLRAEIIREKGTNRSQFFRGEVDKYSWVDVGSSYLPSEILAAFLYAQLEVAHDIQTTRKRIWHHYFNNLQAWAKKNNIILPTVPDDCEQAYHMFYMILPNLDIRTELIDFLKLRDINAVFHYQDLNSSTMGSKFGGKKGDCPVSENMSDRVLRLPFFNSLTIQDQNRVIEEVLSFKSI